MDPVTRPDSDREPERKASLCTLIQSAITDVRKGDTAPPTTVAAGAAAELVIKVVVR